MTCKIVPDMTYNVFGGTLNLALSWGLDPSGVACSIHFALASGEGAFCTPEDPQPYPHYLLP